MQEAQADVRELYRVFGEMRSEVLTQVTRLETAIDKRLDKLDTTWDSRFRNHESVHQIDETKRRSLVMWSITTVAGIGGTVIALILGILNVI